MYAANFESEGYTELDFIATMKMGVRILFCNAWNTLANSN